jgi:TonB family protein
MVAQQSRVAYGPVIKAFLTGLDEELNELEFQLNHNEISRPDYERAKQRLAVLRRSVERYAAENREDIVPEYQVLAEDEMSTLGLSREFKSDELIAGAELDGSWKIAGVQFAGDRKLTKFLVLERLYKAGESAAGTVVRESRLGRTIDPRDVIETIVVKEKPPLAAQPPATSNPEQSVEPASAQKGSDQLSPAVQKPRLQAPRIVYLYLPEYTGKARDRKIEGDLALNAEFQRDGRIRNIKIEKGLGFGLDERAVEAIKRIGFIPAHFDGRDVDVRIQIVFGFKLEKVSVYVGAAEMIEKSIEEKF